MREPQFSQIPKTEIPPQSWGDGFSFEDENIQAQEKETQPVEQDTTNSFKENRDQAKEKTEEIAREKLLDILEQGAYLENKNGVYIIDLEKIQQDDLWSKISNKYLSSKNSVTIKVSQHIIFDLLRDLQVVSREDFEKTTDGNKLQPRALFNIPASLDEAFNLDKIKEHNYYLNFWDLSKNLKSWSHKLKAKNGDEIDMRELSIATKIFHDLKGKRDSSGKLFVYDNEKDSYVTISNEFLLKKFGSSGTKFDHAGIHYLLQEHGATLREKNILTNNDFASQTIGATSEIKRKEFHYKGNGMQVMINNVIYYIGRDTFIYEGRKIPLENIKIVVLDNQTAGVVETLNNKESLRYTINLLNSEEIAQKRKDVQEKYDRPLSRKDISSRSLITKKEIDQRISSWRVTNDNPKRENETPEDYAERIATLADYKFISKITDDFVQNSKVAIHKNLSWREQQWLASAAYSLGTQGRYNELLDFGKKYKENGLKTFLSMEFGQEMGEKILSIGKRFDQQIANLIFSKYAEIIDTIASIESELQVYATAENTFSRQEITESLLQEGKDILTYFSNLSAKRISPEEIITKLERVNANILLTKNIIHQLPREEISRLDLKKIPHINKFENIPAGELLNHPEILIQMQEIIKSQFPDGDDVAFEKECRTNPNLKITITLANNQVLSFFSREQKSENIDYVDWFIANPNAPIKGLGEATLRLGIESKSETSTSHYAVAKPHAKSFQILIENLGFVAFQGSTLDKEYQHHYARIRQFPSDANFASKNLPKDKRESFFKTIEDICHEEKSIQSIIFEGKAMRACKIIFHGQTHHDDIKKTDPDGWIMKEIDRQNAIDYVLTRFVPQNETKENQTFYAVFEKDTSSTELREELTGVVFPGESISHSDSKKTLSN